MKKMVGLCLFFCLFAGSYPVFAAPLPEISKIQFLPNGQPYHYYYLGDEWVDTYRYDGMPINSDGMVNGLPQGTVDDGFVRFTAVMGGEDYWTNQRYKLDEKDFSMYPQTNMLAPFVIRFDGQVGDAVIDDTSNTVTVKLKSGMPFAKDRIYFDYTNYGCAKYKVFKNGNKGQNGFCYGEGFWLSNSVENLDEIYNQSNVGNLVYSNEETEEMNRYLQYVGAENIDLNKNTFLYLLVGTHKKWMVKYRLNTVFSEELEQRERWPYALPQTAVFDKHVLYQANVIFNLIGCDESPKTVLANGSPLEHSHYTADMHYLVISKQFLDTYEGGESVAFTLQYDSGKTADMKVQITDTTQEDANVVFPDVNVREPYYTFVEALFEKGIVKGDDARFFPQRGVTKAEFCVMAARAIGIEQNGGGNWYEWAVDGLKPYDILPDIEPEEVITCRQAAKALIKLIYLNHPERERLFFSLNTYPGFDKDNKSQDITSYDAMSIDHDSFLYTVPIVPPSLSTADGEMNRAECAKAVYQFLTLSEYLNDDIVTERILYH